GAAGDVLDLPVACLDGVGPRAAVEAVHTRAPVEDVVPGAADQGVVAGAAEQGVVAGAPGQAVAGGSADHHVHRGVDVVALSGLAVVCNPVERHVQRRGPGGVGHGVLPRAPDD